MPSRMSQACITGFPLYLCVLGVGVALAVAPSSGNTAEPVVVAIPEPRAESNVFSSGVFQGQTETNLPLPSPESVIPIGPQTGGGSHCWDTIGPASPCPVNGFHCVGCRNCAKKGKLGWAGAGLGWAGAGPIPWQAFAQGEYIGPARLAHVPEYRLRVDDRLDFVFRLTRQVSSQPYRLEVADVIRIESLTEETAPQEVMVQPDGSITLRQIGQVKVYGSTISELRDRIEGLYRKFVANPAITVSPVSINTRLEELRASVDNRFGRGGQSTIARVTPEGTVQLPGIGSAPAQGLTLDELKLEIDARYRRLVDGLEVTPILAERAPRFVYVVGEVRVPGRYELVGPTTLMQAIGLAGGWNVGGNLQHVVVFRRDNNWNLMATRLNIFAALYGKQPCPADEIWLRDSDIVVVPKRSILVADDFIELVFTRGIYGVVPLNVSVNLARLSSI